MGIRKVEAEIECDGCATTIPLDLDPAHVIGAETSYTSLLDYVEDCFRGLPMCSIQGQHWLCRACTHKVDSAFEEDDATPTHDQVAAVLSAGPGAEEG